MFTIRNPAAWGGGHTEDKRAFDLQIITWNETISNQKASCQKHDKRSHGAAQKDLDTIIAGEIFFSQI